MEVVVPRQEQTNQHTEDNLKFSGCSKALGNSKRKAEEECGGNEKPEQESEGEQNTMGCLKEATVAQEEQLKQDTNIKPDKIQRCSKDFGISYKRRFQEYHTHHTDTNAEGEKDVMECLKETPNHPSKKGFEPKKLAVKNKKWELEDDLLIDEFEQDEEMFFLLRTKNRSRAGKIDNTTQGVKQSTRKCHQCMKKERTSFVPCTKCSKMYCMRCINQWYPDMSIEEVTESCPFCLQNCNCNVCLRTKGTIKTSNMAVTNYEKAQYLHYMINLLLPYLKQICQEQRQEEDIEAKIQGKSSSEIEIPQNLCGDNERVYCDYCATSIIDLHRSCPNCSYELCLKCCQEIRDGSITPRAEMKFQYVNRGYDYMHGGDPLPVSCDLEISDGNLEVPTKWNAKSDGSVSCVPKEIGGCGSSVLELRRILPHGWMSDLEGKTHDMLEIWEVEQKTFQQEVGSNYNSMYNQLCGFNIQEKDSVWCKVWTLEVAERVKSFVWLVLWDRLLTNSAEHRMGLSSPLCSYCDVADETGIHALRDCSLICEFWRQVVPVDKRYIFLVLNLKEWVSDNILNSVKGSQGIAWCDLWALACYCLWTWRNKEVHESNFARPINPVQHVLKLNIDYRRAIRATVADIFNTVADIFNTQNVVSLSRAGIENLAKLEDREEPWLVVLYAPWCRFCQAMEESYVDLAENLAGSGVKVGKFRADGDEKEYAKTELGLGSFPTILFFPKHSSRPIKYPSEKRDVDSLLAFVNALSFNG